jgi:hypothetical protein
MILVSASTAALAMATTVVGRSPPDCIQLPDTSRFSTSANSPVKAIVNVGDPQCRIVTALSHCYDAIPI